MAVRQENVPIYVERAVTLVADQIIDFNVTCEKVTILEVTGDVDIRVNDGDVSTCRGGISFAVPPGLRITRVTFIETASASASVTFAFSNGDIQDNRASFAGDQTVKNAASPNHSLQVDMIAADPGLVALASSITGSGTPRTIEDLYNYFTLLYARIYVLVYDDEVLRSRLTTFDGSSHHYETGSSAETTIVASGTNTAGIIVRHACCSRYGNGDRCYLSTGAGNVIIGNKTAPGSTANPTVIATRDILIPSGVALTCRADNNSEVNVTYEVL